MFFINFQFLASQTKFRCPKSRLKYFRISRAHLGKSLQIFRTESDVSVIIIARYNKPSKTVNPKWFVVHHSSWPKCGTAWAQMIYWETPYPTKHNKKGFCGWLRNQAATRWPIGHITHYSFFSLDFYWTNHLGRDVVFVIFRDNS